MEDRKQQLLQHIIEDYIKTAEPVGSKVLVTEYKLEVSDATVRNDMRKLEEEGYLTHPYTSAGRIPTEIGYRYYAEHLLRQIKPSKKIKLELQGALDEPEDEWQRLKLISKFVAEYVNNAVIIAFTGNNVYYTGTSFLFAQPEFRDISQTIDVSTMFDECEDRIEAVFDRVQSLEPRILIGEDNPLGSVCSLIGSRIGDGVLFTVLGPIRMDYGKSKGVLEYVGRII